MHRPSLFLFSLLALNSSSLAQDMIAVDWNGGLYALDSYQAQLTPLGTGLMGQNATAVDETGRVWSTQVAGAGSQAVFHLTNVDPIAGNAVTIHSNTPDVRALAPASPGHLFAIVNGNPDILHDVDTATGTFTRIGSTGLDAIQGMARQGQTLFAWHVTIGLITLDPATGRARDVNPAVGTPSGSAVQFLAARSDGKLIGGKQDLYEIDPLTGQYTPIGSFGPGVDLRGADEWYGNAHAFGRGCATASGISTLVVLGDLLPGTVVTTRSLPHAANAPGALMLGLSRESYLGLPLPIDLDPLLGTNGCSMWVSMDVVLPGRTGVSDPATLTFQLPLPLEAGGAIVHVQHVVFENVAGGLSTSNGVTVHCGW